MKLKFLGSLFGPDKAYKSEAALTTDQPPSPHGHPVLVLHPRGTQPHVVLPCFCRLLDVRVVEASEEELAALSAAGYDLPIDGAA